MNHLRRSSFSIVFSNKGPTIGIDHQAFVASYALINSPNRLLFTTFIGNPDRSDWSLRHRRSQ
jgi:hypothetical protein